MSWQRVGLDLASNEALLGAPQLSLDNGNPSDDWIWGGLVSDLWIKSTPDEWSADARSLAIYDWPPPNHAKDNLNEPALLAPFSTPSWTSDASSCSTSPRHSHFGEDPNQDALFINDNNHRCLLDNNNLFATCTAGSREPEIPSREREGLGDHGSSTPDERAPRGATWQPSRLAAHLELTLPVPGPSTQQSNQGFQMPSSPATPELGSKACADSSKRTFKRALKKTRKREVKQPPPVADVSSQKGSTRGQALASHNRVEKRYRNRLNRGLEGLLALLPVPPNPGSKRISKMTVLNMAMARIVSLQWENDAIIRERDELLASVAVWEKRVAMLRD